MKSIIIQHNGSPAIPVPQQLLDACHLPREVEIEARTDCLIVRGPHSPRAGWEREFRQMATSGDDRMVLKDAPASRWDEEEWEW